MPAPSAVAPPDCADCLAWCCRLEVLCLSDTGVPPRYLTRDRWGRTLMRRLDDGWCAALDRERMRCLIYPWRPLLCREYPMGGEDCLAERAAGTLPVAEPNHRGAV